MFSGSFDINIKQCTNQFFCWCPEKTASPLRGWGQKVSELFANIRFFFTPSLMHFRGFHICTKPSNQNSEYLIDILFAKACRLIKPGIAYFQNRNLSYKSNINFLERSFFHNVLLSG